MRTTWRELSARQERNDLPWLLGTHWVDLSPEDVRDGVRDAWTRPEWPEHHLGRQTWVMLFRHAGYLSDDDSTLESLPAALTLYRGATPEHRDGMSWTDQVDRAHWFAHRFDEFKPSPGQVWTATVPRELVLARFVGRGEHEWVVDTTDFGPDDATPLS